MGNHFDQMGGAAVRRITNLLLPAAMAAGAFFVAAPAATAASVHPAATACYGPACNAHGSITVSVSYGPHGVITLTVTVSGFTPGEQVDITLTNPSESGGAFVANSSGSASGQIQLPAGYGAGTHGADALGTVSGKTASTTFTLSRASQPVFPCATSASTTHTSGIVLAAAYLTGSCLNNQAPGSAGLPGSAGGPPGAAPAAVGIAKPQNASQLPFTGFNASTYAAIGALAIGAGGALVLVSRRRRQAAWK